jgi:hypothetical protein
MALEVRGCRVLLVVFLVQQTVQVVVAAPAALYKVEQEVQVMPVHLVVPEAAEQQVPEQTLAVAEALVAQAVPGPLVIQELQDQVLLQGEAEALVQLVLMVTLVIQGTQVLAQLQAAQEVQVVQELMEILVIQETLVQAQHQEVLVILVQQVQLVT